MMQTYNNNNISDHDSKSCKANKRMNSFPNILSFLDRPSFNTTTVCGTCEK